MMKKMRKFLLICGKKPVGLLLGESVEIIHVMCTK